MSKQVKPFDSKRESTAMHNALFDVILPAVSSAAWKVICLFVRQTDGWNRASDQLSIRDIMSGTGIRSNNTVIKALAELCSHPLGHIVHFSQTNKMQPRSYWLNYDLSIKWEPHPDLRKRAKGGAENAPPQSGKGGAENAPPLGAENAPPAGAENAPHVRKEIKTIESHVDKTPAHCARVASALALAHSLKPTPAPRQLSDVGAGAASSPKAATSTPPAPSKTVGKVKQPKKPEAEDDQQGRPWTDPFYDTFAAKHFTRYRLKYIANKDRDFPALKRLAAGLGAELSLLRWEQACEHYFKSPAKPKHTISNLCYLFPTFFEAPQDRYGVPNYAAALELEQSTPIIEVSNGAIVSITNGSNGKHPTFDRQPQLSESDRAAAQLATLRLAMGQAAADIVGTLQPETLLLEPQPATIGQPDSAK